MDFWSFMLKFLILMAVVCVPLILFLRWALVSDADKAVRRLDLQAEGARAKQAELERKIKEADEELSKRKAESDRLTQKMITEAEEKAREEREKLIQKARTEGEEIITKAQATKDNIRKELEKEMFLKAIDYAIQIVTAILSQEARGILSNRLLNEFKEGLEKVDMSRIGLDVTTAAVMTAFSLENEGKDDISKILNDKLKRAIQIEFQVDPQIVGGAVLKFGSLALDGSLHSHIKEAAVGLKQKMENE